MRILLRVIAIFAFPAICFSATFYVPQDYTKIQEAIDAALNGDMIIVKPGTYFENIDFKGKAVTVKSEQGPDATAIDGSWAGTVVSFCTEEGFDTVLEGFTLTNGSGSVVNTDPPELGGGGVLCIESSPTLLNNRITGNSVCPEEGSALGGGIYCDNASPSILYNLISKNGAFGSWYGQGRPANGGGIYCASSSPEIINNLISENCASGAEGSNGGGIYCTDSHPVITNNTITRNSAGGGIYCQDSTPCITNTILWNNFGELGFEGSMPIMTYCDVKGGTGQPWFGEGCIDSRPYFLAPLDDFHIVNFSPCRNAGTNDAPGLPDKDFEGDDRILEETVDIGADEFSTPQGASGTYYVPGDYSSIQEAIESAFPLDTIAVHPGSHFENINFLAKAVSVQSCDGPELTFLDGGMLGSVVTFTSMETEESKLKGFTITNGWPG
ncbi:MAG: right-handed parallel beta-helix repeat-containing protein, partial [Planctomycetota bacterium]